MIRFARWAALLLMLSTLVAAPLRPASAQDDAQAQLDATAAAMLALKSFHFQLDTTVGSTAFQEVFELKTVSGDIVRPSDFQAKVEVKLAIVTVTLEVIGVDGAIWVKNPIGGDDSFIQVTGDGSEFSLPPLVFLNPDSLVSNALQSLDDPVVAGTEELNGQQTTVITGTFSPAKLLGSGTPIAELGSFTPSTKTLDVKAWIDDHNRLVRIDFSGPLFGFEEGSGELVRSITLSNFDADVTITPPA